MNKEIPVFRAKVVRGEGRGKKIGFPTANLDAPAVDFGYGVYLVEAELEGKKYLGLMHFGPKETFGESSAMEIHIKDFNRDIYGQELAVRVIKRIRNIKKFDSEEGLKARIALDIKKNFE